MTVRRHGRTAAYPVRIPYDGDSNALRVVVVYSVCYRFRMPIFRRLSSTSGLSVKFLVGTGYPGTKVVNASDLSGIDVEVLKTCAMPVMSTGRSVLLSFNPTLLWWLAKAKPQVLVVQGGEFLNNVVTLIYAKIRRVPIVWWSLGEVRNRQFKGLSRIYRRCVQFVERQSDAFAAYSSVGVDYFLRVGIDRKKIFNLVNVVDTDLVEKNVSHAQGRVDALRHELDVQGRTVVLYVGAMTREKAVDRLIRSFSSVAENNPNALLVMVGDGPERASAELLAKGSTARNRIRFVGDVYEGVSAYFLLSDLVVVPGTGGLVVSDAMAHGRPVIAAIGDGVECDLIDHEESGYLLSENTDDELVRVLAKALTDRRALRIMGERALRRIRSEASIGRYMNELLGAILFASRAKKEHPE